MSIAFGGDRCFASRMGRDTASKEGERRGGSVPPVGGGGDVRLPPRARSFLRGKIHRRARGGCFGGPPRPGRGASVRAYLGAARASGARAPGRTIWPVPAGDACASRVVSLAFARGIGRFAREGEGRCRAWRFNRWSGCRMDTHHGRGRGRVRPRGRERRACDEGRGEGWVSDAFGAPPARLHREKGFGGGTSGPWRRTRCRLLRERLQLREAHHAELFRLRRGHRRALPHDRRRRRRHVETVSGAREK